MSIIDGDVWWSAFASMHLEHPNYHSKVWITLTDKPKWGREGTLNFYWPPAISLSTSCSSLFFHFIFNFWNKQKYWWCFYGAWWEDNVSRLKTMTEVKKHIYEKEKTTVNSGIFSWINRKQKTDCSVFCILKFSLVLKTSQ